MGTSQSFSLKTTPNWTEAKRAMTALTKPEGRTENNIKRYLGNFSRAVSSNEGRVFGNAGRRISTNFISFIGDVRDNGLQHTVANLIHDKNFSDLSSKEILLYIYQYIVGQDDANIDDNAAKTAMDMLLTKIFSECENPADIETLISEATKDEIEGWFIEYNVEYIMEFNAELFQTHIFEKEADPDVVCDAIKNYVSGWFQNHIKSEIGHINIFSEEGKIYVEELTNRVLSIWAQELK